MVRAGAHFLEDKQYEVACSLVLKLRTGGLADMLGLRSNINFRRADLNQQKMSILTLMRDVMLGVAELQAARVMHGDLHSENIAVIDYSENKRMQIIDLNEAVILNDRCLFAMKASASKLPEWLLRNPLRWLFFDKLGTDKASNNNVHAEFAQHAACMDIYTFFVSCLAKFIDKSPLSDWLKTVMLQCKSTMTSILGVDIASVNYRVGAHDMEDKTNKHIEPVTNWFVDNKLFVFEMPAECANIMWREMQALSRSSRSSSSSSFTGM